MKPYEIKTYLDTLREEGNLRELQKGKVDGKYITVNGRSYLNLCSNDYLGLTSDNAPSHLGLGGHSLQWVFFRQLGDTPPFLMSNPSSRLLGCDALEYDVLERSLAELFPRRRKALVLNSGFAANLGVLGALTGKEDLILADKSCHASLIDGLRLCDACWQRFRHNDMNHLERILQKERGRYRNVWVVTESVFSMGGDRSPLREIVALKERYDLQILLDEAHSFGLCGPRGAGYACELGVADKVDVITGSLGKAIASSGGFVVTDTYTRELLVNRMRPLIFSTAMPTINLVWSHFVISRLADFEPRRRHLRQLSATLSGQEDSSQIVPIMTGSNALTAKMTRRLREAGFWTSMIRHPTVPKGTERVRLTVNASMTLEEIENFRQARNRIEESLGISYEL